MTSIIKLTPISGVMGESPPCYLLQIDEFRVLLDTGWDENFDRGIGDRLGKMVEKIDAVLLSHSDVHHLGALAYLVGKCGLDCPVYATAPVWKMGQMFLYDCYLNHRSTSEFPLFDLDDIDCAFDKIVVCQFDKGVGMKGKGHGINVTPIQAGHTLGGAVWKISKTGEEDIFYAVDHNNKKERHLNGFEGGAKGGVLITNCLNSLCVQEKRRKRDERLLGVINQTMSMGGNVLVASDTAGRSLELTLMLDQMWRMKDSGLSSFSLVFLNNVAFNVLEFAKEQIEWMGEKLQKSYESTRVNPFQLRNVVVCHTLVELAQVPSPKVVIASSADMESGFSRDLFLQWCQDVRCSVVVTQKTAGGTLGRRLVNEHVQGGTINLEVRGKVRVDGGGGEERELRNNNNFEGGRKRSGGGERGVKYVCVTQAFVVNCGVHFIEFEGRSDVEASGRIVQEMEPDKLVLVRGTTHETAAFGTICQSILPSSKIYFPGIGDVVELTSGRDVAQVTLSEQLTSKLEYHKLRGMELAWVDGQIGEESKEKGKSEDPLALNTPRLYPVKSLKSPRPKLYVNKLRLSEFKQILSKHGIQGVYNDKVLTVQCSGGAVYIQRHSDTKEIVMECDGLVEEYYAIRRLLYEQFALL